MPAVKKVGAGLCQFDESETIGIVRVFNVVDIPIMRVEICIKKAVPLQGHSLDHVRPAHPISSTIVDVSGIGYR